MNTVFILQHVHVSENGQEEDVKIIGIYSSRESAESAVERARGLPGFRLHQEGFEITEYDVDKDHWTEGFISWKDAVE